MIADSIMRQYQAGLQLYCDLLQSIRGMNAKLPVAGLGLLHRLLSMVASLDPQWVRLRHGGTKPDLDRLW